MAAYWKSGAALVVAVIIAGVTAWQAAAGDGWQAQEWATVILAALSPIAVYLAPRNVYTDTE